MNLAQRIMMARRMGSAPEAPEPYWGDVVLLLKGDGAHGSTDIIDYSQEGHSLSVTGETSFSGGKTKFGCSSILFDRSGGVRLPVSSSLTLTNDFTIECWASGGGQYGTFIGDIPGTTFIETGYSRGVFIRLGGHNAGYTSFNPNDGLWKNYTLTREGDAIKFFLDGVHRASLNTANVFDLSNGWVGVSGQGLQYSFDGHIAELRVTKGVARYTSNFTPPTAPFPTTGP